MKMVDQIMYETLKLKYEIIYPFHPYIRLA